MAGAVFPRLCPPELVVQRLDHVLLHVVTAGPAEREELRVVHLRRGRRGELGQLPGCTWEEALAGWLLSVCAATASAALSEQPRCVALSAHTWDSSWRFSLAELCGLPEEAELDWVPFKPERADGQRPYSCTCL